ncbi:TSC13 [[Candida] subhashii]|uniref:TSC13 n=1 Tax=[Candida] subhashii TaxID=561895 RepID=A0A8J5QL39_9ASCO|nr:TSC13 [[Candida] subhashii]KAG7662445.1 TSC13 [[Candida] subhashii]
MTTIDVRSRSKSIKGLSSNELTPDDLVSDLVHELCNDNNISQHRLRLTMFDKTTGKQKPLDINKTFMDNGVPENAKYIELFAKDLGPQISWRTVFIVEYFGPFIFHPIFYFFKLWYGVDTIEHTQTQQLAFIMVLLHFLKREYETINVHKFSNATMPIFNIFKNSSHYWILSGFNLAYFIYGPTHDSGISKYIFHVNDLPSWLNYTLFGLWVYAELSNYITHKILAGLRDKDTKKYVIPFGYGFNLVACPNYFFESLSWLAYALMVGNWSAWLFLAVSAGQMWLWAIKKNKRYLKTFGDDYKKLKRKIFVPFVI